MWKYTKSASRRSFERGVDYTKRRKVLLFEKVSDSICKSKVQGQGENVYDVLINLEKPKSSKCSCPFAEGKKVICKHMVATYFTAFPEEFDAYLEHEANIAKQYEDGHKKREERIKNYVDNLSIDELKEKLLAIYLETSIGRWEMDYFDDDKFDDEINALFDYQFEMFYEDHWR